MTAKDFLKEHGIPNMPTQYSPQFQTDVNDTEKALEAYHQAKLKLLGIADVVGRSEQLDCDHDWQSVYHHNDLIGRYCPECKELRAD